MNNTQDNATFPLEGQPLRSLTESHCRTFGCDDEPDEGHTYCPACELKFQVYSQGGRARQYGQKRKENPYAAGTWEHYSWDCGWADEK